MKLGKFAKGVQKQIRVEKTRKRIAANAQKVPTTLPGKPDMQPVYEIPKLNYKTVPTKRLIEHGRAKPPKAKPKRRTRILGISGRKPQLVTVAHVHA